MDGVEFFPTNKYVLFGFQWKAVAALGPALGPIIAIQWGWLPGLLWLLVGNAFFGWLHDYIALTVSVRSEGASLGPLAYELIGKRSRIILVSFLLFYFLLLLAVYGVTCASTLGGAAQAAIPVLIAAVVSIAAGIATFKYKMNVVYTTIIALALIAAGIWVGSAYPFVLPAWMAKDPYLVTDFWFLWVLALCYLGSVLPAWLFVQPFIYLTFYPVYFCVVAMIMGAFVGQPNFAAPAITTFFDPKLTPSGPLWPLMFVTIACGAISGMHGIIGASATSKQLDLETDAPFVGGGAMLAEGILAIVALVAIAVMSPAEIAGKAPGARWVIGGSKLMGFLGFSPAVGSTIAAVALVLLALALVLVLRLTRLVLVEFAGKYGGYFKNIYFSSLLLCVIAYILGSPRMGAVLAYTWPLWGGANQLLAGIVLMIGTLWLMKQKKPSYFTSIPMVFMFGTTIVALLWLSYLLFANALFPTVPVTGLYLAGNMISGAIGIVLVILSFVLLYDGAKAFQKLKGRAK